MDKPKLKIALPKGRLMNETAALLKEAGWGLDEYFDGTRHYRPESAKLPQIAFKIFHEKDIPVQVAIGNYDIGICGLDWVEELTAKYPGIAVVKVKDLGYGKTALYLAANRSFATDLTALKKIDGVVRIASEYPNLAESLALNLRLKRFNIFPVWGAAESYPPENAEMVLISGRTGQEFFDGNLTVVCEVCESSAYIIANKTSGENKEFDKLLGSLYEKIKPTSVSANDELSVRLKKQDAVSYPPAEGTIRLALPDGHQQKPTVELLNKAGINIEDYPSKTGNSRPVIHLSGVTVKVIRPQDMPLQVANGNFDLAITGKDWTREHLDRFPYSPVKELLDLKFGWVRIVAVVHGALPITDLSGFKQLAAQRPAPLRIATEYVNIADKYARDSRLGMYCIIPTWGATEAFLPDDADMLIENTQTGKTLAQHGLRIIDTLFESTACLIGNTAVSSMAKESKIKSIVTTLRRALEES